MMKEERALLKKRRFESATLLNDTVIHFPFSSGANMCGFFSYLRFTMSCVLAMSETGVSSLIFGLGCFREKKKT